MIQEEQIGKRIKEQRSKKGITLQELSKKTRFTKGYLSRIENSKKAPPVSTLITLAKALDLTVSDILDETDEKGSVSVVKKNERLLMARNGTMFGYSYESLAHGFHRKHMEPYVVTLPVHPKANAVFQHEGEEMLFVLEGVMRFFHGGKEFLLRRGDCVYFDTSVPHYGLCQGKKEVKCLSVIFMPE